MTRHRWPTKIVRGETVIIMCRRARCADDPQHAPDKIFGWPLMTYCTCGERIEDADEVKALPAY